jgi:hypothetical protein
MFCSLYLYFCREASFNGAAGFSAYNYDASSALDITMSAVQAIFNGHGEGAVGSGASGIHITSKGKCSVDFDLVSAEENENGIHMTCNGGGEIRMKDVSSAISDGTGIMIRANEDTTIDLEGSIENGTSGVMNGVRSRGNGAGGLVIIKANQATPAAFKLNVVGDVVLERNGQNIPYSPGFLVSAYDSSSTLDVVVGAEGSFTVCDNPEIDSDIYIRGGFTWVGDKTCDPNKTWIFGVNFFNCLPCPP